MSATKLFRPLLRTHGLRTFSTISPAYSKVPSIRDITASDSISFRRRQIDFRENLEAERQSREQLETIEPGTAGVASSVHDRDVKADDEARGSQLTNYDTGDQIKAEEAKRGKRGRFSNLIYGTAEARKLDNDIERSFSEVVARGKYVHSIVFHEVKPDKVKDYVELGYEGYHSSLHEIGQHPEFSKFDNKLKSLIKSKKTSLMQEFSFWPTTPPRRLGGLFELRSYTLHPGQLLEWETYWRRGLHARREVMEGVGAWFVQIGELNTVHHLWQYADLEERKIQRETSWNIQGWAETVHKTVPLIQTMRSSILVPMPWSPIG
ncbi:Dimeric alpha-beta barrel [Ascosphaera apis ARSEF 7405]|uniref:Dimeric alpha-beta barrel n=1 Tax=Ascosphaera apis ARSEF 7405 TaxID=392613 RepID=A0A168CQU0_9EURO|nr:Dimeric alpha-beta barrel [Ascosphaera apis ARSEF 7405]